MQLFSHVEGSECTHVPRRPCSSLECLSLTYTAVMDVPEIIGLYNVKSILTDKLNLEAPLDNDE